MITAQDNINSLIYQTNDNDAYNGVLRISDGTSYGTGSLLYDGRTIITAAHIFDYQDLENAFIYLSSSGDNSDFLKTRANVNIYDYIDTVNFNGDIALVTLRDTYDVTLNRYDLYRQSDEIGQTFTMIGYGLNGTGTTGYVDTDETIKLKTYNRFDATAFDLYNSSKTDLTWIPTPDSNLIADFDSGLQENDALGYVLNIDDLGLGSYEGIIAPGDSGGPAFINGNIAGIASYGTSVETTSFSSDVTPTLDGSFGEIASWERVSYYQEWIDKTIRDNYIDAPTKKEDVKQEVSENDTYAYFMVEYTLDRNLVNDIISVDYKTLDGTATAGEDFIATSGTLNLYTDESYAIIAVELINDNLKETDEYFYLEISNPINASFGNQTTLTATRTIYDDTTWG